ncbi:MAG: serpin family protein [Candidatus Fermentibacteraceae bacterium]|nr:serpin family protein [Candidatus Fermentibacteraceae bacterium]
MGKLSMVPASAVLLSFACICTSLGASDDGLTVLAADNTTFAMDLYRVLASDDGNIFFSPFSISTALAMTYAGAGGVTEEQMRDVLNFSLPGDELHRAFRDLKAHLDRGTGEDAGFELRTVNALWGQSGYEFLPGFLALLSDDYGSGLRLLDFSEDPESCRETINLWVAEQTAGRIADLIPQELLTTATRLVLTNAIYFKADWLFQFDPMGTAPRDFSLLSGVKVEVPTMTVSEHFRTAEGCGYSAVELPYRERDFFMLVILPDEGMFSDVEERLDGELVDEIMEGLGDASLILRLPKFQSVSRFLLEDALYGMGMTSAFGPEADFSGMDGTRWLYISSVVHQAFVSVDEYGTEAAAATAVVMAKMNGESASPFSVDRPFIYLVMDRTTGTVLFMGRVLDPRE